MNKALTEAIIISAALIILPAKNRIEPQQAVEQPLMPVLSGEVVTKSDADSFLVLETSTGLVSEIPVREYVIGAVCAEMPLSFSDEALKAQAVAAHTYALRRSELELQSPTPSLCGAYISDDPYTYQGFLTKDELKANLGERFEEEYARVGALVDEVLDEVLMYDGELIVAAFHSISPGRTESAENIWGGSASYLCGVESPYDAVSELCRAEVSFTAKELSARLTAAYPDIALPENRNEWLVTKEASDAGTVLSIGCGSVTLSGTELRALLSLRSAAFTVSYDEATESFCFVTMGSGHGVGLSQYGADSMAKAGSNYREILAHYYPQTVLVEDC